METTLVTTKKSLSKANFWLRLIFHVCMFYYCAWLLAQFDLTRSQKWHIAFYLGGGLVAFDRGRIWASMRWPKVGDFWNWMGFREEERYSTWTGLYSIAAFIFLMLIDTPNWILSIAIAHLAFVDGFSKLGAIWPIAPLTIGDPQKSVGGFLAGFVLGGSCTGVHLFAFYSHIADTGTLLILLGISTIVVSFLEVFDGGKYDNILIPLGSAGTLAAFSPLIT